jgi:hypothetical protein
MDGVFTRNEQELEAPTQNRANRIIWFGKPEGPVSSGLAAVEGAVDSGTGILLLAMWRLTRWRDKIHHKELWWRLVDLNEVKNEKKIKLRSNV